MAEIKRPKVFDYSSLETNFFDYDFFYCLKALCKEDSGTILYKNAENHLNEFLDIQTLFLRYTELEMMKIFLFDKNQKQLFEILAKLNNIKRFFSEMEGRKDLFDYGEKEMCELVDSIKHMKTRGNETDVKILEHLNQIFH